MGYLQFQVLKYILLATDSCFTKLYYWAISLTAVDTTCSVPEWKITLKTSLSLTSFLRLKKPVLNILPVSAGPMDFCARNVTKPNTGRQEVDI